MEIRNMFNYVKLFERKVYGVSNTVPDRSLTVTEIMARFVVGMPPTTLNTYYDEQYDSWKDRNDSFDESYDTMRDYDLTEMEDYSKQHSANYRELSEARKKFRADLDQRNEDKKYYERLNREGYGKKSEPTKED